MANERLDFSKIPQNSRTIIIERFNDQASNLCTLLKGQDADEAIQKVEKELCVKSFEEFKARFKPTVYECVYTDEYGNPYVKYFVEKQDNVPANAIELCEHEFYKAVHYVANEKSGSSKDNDNQDYSKLYEALDPKHIYTRARRRRDEVKQFITNALEAEEQKNPDAVKKWMLMAKDTYTKVKNDYSGSALRLLPLVIRDAEAALESRGVSMDSKGELPLSEVISETRPAALVWNEEGELTPIEIQPGDAPAVKGLEMRQQKVMQLTAKGWNNVVDSMDKGSVDKNTFLSVFSEQQNQVLANLPTDELIKRHDVFSDWYTAGQQSFCDAIGTLVQKVASLEQFFIHAGDEKGIVESGVIIANCSLSDIIDEDENKNNVRNYLRNAGNHERDKIWFAVLPAASDKNKEWTETTSSGNATVENMMDDMTFTDDSAQKSQAGVETATVSGVKRMAKLLSEFGILSFFNFTACEKTSFKSFGSDSKILEQYREELELDTEKPEGLVLAFPNFTIIPKSKRCVETVGGRELYTPSVYIDAAYVAAGLTAATQNARIQTKKFGEKVKQGNPFIHFNLEDEENSKHFPAKFNPESRLNMDPEVSEMLKRKDGFGFCFRSDSLVPNAFVFTARTLNGMPVYQYVALQYFKFLINRMYRSDVTVEKAKQFDLMVSNYCSNENTSEIVNPLLLPDDRFTFLEETNEFELRFKGTGEAIHVNVKVNTAG